MRAFLVKLPSLVRYWTVVDDGYCVVRVADEYLQHLRLGQDAAESTTKAYAEALALYLRWCEQGSRDWRTAAERLGGFITWLRHTPGDPDAPLAGPGIADVRGAGRINRILSAVRGFLPVPVPLPGLRPLPDRPVLPARAPRLSRQPPACPGADPVRP